MSNQSQRVLATLRSMILSGELAPGDPLAEIPLAERLGASRTPVRMAIRLLEQEGLAVNPGNRRYVVREIRPEEISDAVEVRGVLEGLAARLVTERGVPAPVLKVLRGCLEEGDGIFASGKIVEDDVVAYHDMNRRFHEAVVSASGNAAIADALARNDHLPFASSSSIAFDRNRLEGEFQRLYHAHLQHHVIVEAMEGGQARRAEDVMREHALVGLKYGHLYGLQDSTSGLTLISSKGGKKG